MRWILIPAHHNHYRTTETMIIKGLSPKDLFFTSDLHFGHDNIIRHCRRPFQDAAEMDEALIARWNSRVPQKGTVFVLGDFSFSKDAGYLCFLLEKLHGKKYLVPGNHDYFSQAPDHPALRKFQAVSPLMDIQVKDEELGAVSITLCHYALRVWNRSHYGSWHLFGHSHGTLDVGPDARLMDVGVDAHLFFPVGYDVVKAYMLARPGDGLVIRGDRHKDVRPA